jgi:hypothetical protein
MGPQQILENNSIDITSNSWHTVRLEVNGWSFRVYVDRNLVIDASDSGMQRLDIGRLGFQGSLASTVWFDDVQVWEPAH